MSIVLSILVLVTVNQKLKLVWIFTLLRMASHEGLIVELLRVTKLYLRIFKEFVRIEKKTSTLSSEKKVWAQIFFVTKPFKICHIYRKSKPTYFLFFISNNFEFYLINIDRDQGIYKVKSLLKLKEKLKKLTGFSFSINMANFEAFRRNKKLRSALV